MRRSDVTWEMEYPGGVAGPVRGRATIGDYELRISPIPGEPVGAKTEWQVVKANKVVMRGTRRRLVSARRAAEGWVGLKITTDRS
jgi:hypothetical protein